MKAGDRVETPQGPGTVVYLRRGPPDYSKPVAISVRLDSKAGKPRYAGTMFHFNELTYLREEVTGDPLFVLRVELLGEVGDVPYMSIDHCLTDSLLRFMLDRLGAKCSLFCGSLRLTAKQITTWAELQEQIRKNSAVILRRYSDEP